MSDETEPNPLENYGFAPSRRVATKDDIAAGVIALRRGIDAILSGADDDSNPYLVFLASLASEHSRRTMRGALRRIAGMIAPGVSPRAFPWWSLDYAATTGIRTRLVERYAPASARVHLAALRGVLRESWRLGRMDGETYHRAIALPPVKGSRLPAGREIAVAEIGKLFEACASDPTPRGRRDAALLGLAFGAGLRRSEIAALTVADFDATTAALRLIGKGDRERIAFATNGTRDALAAWLDVRGADPGPFLRGVNRHGRIGGGMTAQAVLLALQRLAARAGVAPFTPHDCRRSFVSRLLDAGADVVSIAALAGHQSIETTRRYDRRGARAAQAAAALLAVPYLAPRESGSKSP